MTNAVTVKSDGAPTTRPRLDVKKLMSHHMAPFEIESRWHGAFSLIGQHGSKFDRNAHRELYALQKPPQWPGERQQAYALAVKLKAQLPDVDSVGAEIDRLREIMDAPPDEATVRLLIGTMLDGFPQRPGESAPVRFDALVFSIEDLEPGDGERYRGVPRHVPAAAIAAAIKEAWVTARFSPSINEFALLCRKHRLRLVDVLERLIWLDGIQDALSEVIDAVGPADESVVPGPGDLDDEIPF